MSNPIPLHCKYRNKKTGEIYFAFGLATNTTNDQDGQAMIAYQKNKLENGGPNQVFVREASEFIEKFERVI